MGEQIFLKATFTIDPAKKPKTIDYQMTDGFTKGKKQLGIYEVDGDTFKLVSAVRRRAADGLHQQARDGRTLSV